MITINWYHIAFNKFTQKGFKVSVKLSDFKELEKYRQKLSTLYAVEADSVFLTYSLSVLRLNQYAEFLPPRKPYACKQ